MPSTSTDRLAGLSTSVAIKPAVKAVATANVTLSGEQSISGFSVVSGDRVLLIAQTNGVDNGIWVVSTGAWTRALDFDGNRDVAPGTIVIGPTTGSGYSLGGGGGGVTSDYPEGDVRNYGAVGDGVTDDTAAFAAAIADSAIILIPEGTFLLDTVVIDVQDLSGKTFRGASCQKT